MPESLQPRYATTESSDVNFKLVIDLSPKWEARANRRLSMLNRRAPLTQAADTQPLGGQRVSCFSQATV